jgi:hypothetical protein
VTLSNTRWRLPAGEADVTKQAGVLTNITDIGMLCIVGVDNKMCSCDAAKGICKIADTIWTSYLHLHMFERKIDQHLTNF